MVHLSRFSGEIVSATKKQLVMRAPLEDGRFAVFWEG
jgi:hypothetical protein